MEERGASMGTNEIFESLNNFSDKTWTLDEPEDILRLYEYQLPPMGNLPCCFYACFNLFWLSENLQAMKDIAQNQEMDVEALTFAIAKIVERSADRLSKWQLTDTVDILKDLQNYFLSNPEQEYRTIISVLREAILSINKMQSWIDALIPWSLLDNKLSLRSLMSKKE